MIRVFWKAAVPVSPGYVLPLKMPWTSYAAARLEAAIEGPHAVLIRLPGDESGPLSQFDRVHHEC